MDHTSYLITGLCTSVQRIAANLSFAFIYENEPNAKGFDRTGASAMVLGLAPNTGASDFLTRLAPAPVLDSGMST